jgi:endoglucanase
MLDLLARLDTAVGVSGDEEAVAAIVRDELDGAYDEHFVDALGNNFFVRRGADDAPAVMLSAHTDELGFVVQHVEDEGFLRIAPVGYHDARMVVNQVLRVRGEHGQVDGITGAKPSHVLTDEERKHVIPFERLHVDLGTSSREETEALGVRVGDLVTFGGSAGLLNGTRVYCGKAVDDRAGCAVLVEVMRRLSGRDVAATVWGVAAVQEELGIRGAGPAAFRIKPDVALALDVTLCGDTPGMELSRVPIRLGAGPAITYFDWDPGTLLGNAVPRRLTRRLEQAAGAAGVPFQRDVLIGGGTDAWAISLSGEGVLAGIVSVPSRYIHSAVGCVHLDDLEQAVELVLAFLEGLREPLAPPG